jgi:hypothetical protein
MKSIKKNITKNSKIMIQTLLPFRSSFTRQHSSMKITREKFFQQKKIKQGTV